MKYCRWRLEVYCPLSMSKSLVYKQSFRSIDSLVKCACGFIETDVDVLVYDNDDDSLIDISDLVYSQRDFNRHFYCVR